jgi:hypothetical protein
MRTRAVDDEHLVLRILPHPGRRHLVVRKKARDLCSCRTAATVSPISNSALQLLRRFRRRRREFGNRVSGSLRAPLILTGVIVLRRGA